MRTKARLCPHGRLRPARLDYARLVPVGPHRQQADEERAEDRLYTEPEQGEPERRRVLVSQRAEPGSRPVNQDDREQAEPADQEREAEEEPVLEPDPFA